MGHKRIIHANLSTLGEYERSTYQVLNAQVEVTQLYAQLNFTQRNPRLEIAEHQQNKLNC